MRNLSFIAVLAVGFCSLACRSTFNPNQKYSVEQLKADYTLMRNALEEAHPGIYRYTSRDSMNLIFDTYAKRLDTAMTEREFRRAVNPVFSYVRCGHTDIYQSVGSARFYKDKKNKGKEIPLETTFLGNKLWISANLSNDSTLKIGSEILKIDGRTTAEIVAEMRLINSSDGYNETFKNTRINGSFRNFYWFLYGDRDKFVVTTRDSTGRERTDTLTTKKVVKTAPKPKADSTKKVTVAATPKKPKEHPKRNFKFSDKDSTVAIIDINSFSDGGYKRFYRKSFKKIKQNPKIMNLIFDLRANGGGRSDASINLMSYILDSNYVAYDTVFAVKRRTSFEKYFGVTSRMLRFATRNFWSKKLPNGGMESNASNKVHKPNKKYHFDGNVYILTNGGSFSATAIFTSMVRQYSPNVVTIGRETGGGRYGCNAMISPYMVLPNTQSKVRMPMYKVVLHIPGKDPGRGVMPDYPVEYTFADTHANRDLDFDKAYALIKAKKLRP